MVSVIRCESEFRHFLSKGIVLVHQNYDKKGKKTTIDIGRFQINSSWIPTAKKLGYDIFTDNGNYQMALWIFYNTKSGINNWVCNSLV